MKNKYQKHYEKPLTEQLKNDIIGAYRRGRTFDEIAGYTKINVYRIMAVIIDNELAIRDKECD